MTETAQLAKQNGDQRTFDDPLALCIVSLINAMKADFGHKFKSQFGDPEALRLYKRRLYAKLKGLEIPDIVDGYERYFEKNTEWPPTVPQLFSLVEQAIKSRVNAEKNRVEAERLAELPPPKHQCDPLAMLADAKAGSGKPGSKAAALQNHAAVLELSHSKTLHSFAGFEHGCTIPGCSNAGTISAGTVGGSNFYCREHFRMA
ncbi:MAG: hypothetical protein KGZ88_11945 [Methylomicrobium sp.]|nr:hypothetical protein [Methylomicrobium sp.]